MKKNALLLAFAAFAAFGSINAQTNSSTSVAAVDMSQFADFEVVPEETVTYSNKTDFNWEEFEVELDETQVNWTFHTDLANRILYIDFEALGSKMSWMELLNHDGKVLFSDKELQTLPANTIYEVNLKDLQIGKYFVLLHTLNGSIRQEISITE